MDKLKYLYYELIFKKWPFLISDIWEVIVISKQDMGRIFDFKVQASSIEEAKVKAKDHLTQILTSMKNNIMITLKEIEEEGKGND
jgi:hypothetical protein